MLLKKYLVSSFILSISEWVIESPSTNCIETLLKVLFLKIQVGVHTPLLVLTLLLLLLLGSHQRPLIRTWDSAVRFLYLPVDASCVAKIAFPAQLWWQHALHLLTYWSTANTLRLLAHEHRIRNWVDPTSMMSRRDIHTVVIIDHMAIGADSDGCDWLPNLVVLWCTICVPGCRDFISWGYCLRLCQRALPLRQLPETSLDTWLRCGVRARG